MKPGNRPSLVPELQGLRLGMLVLRGLVEALVLRGPGRECLVDGLAGDLVGLVRESQWLAQLAKE